MLTLVACPDCGAPAEIAERFRLASTDGLVDHIALDCSAGHHFRMAADRCAAPAIDRNPQRWNRRVELAVLGA